LLHVGKFWGKTSVHAKDFFINNCSNWKTVEAVCKGFPELNVVSSLALIVESIDSVNTCTLVVSSQQEEVFRVFNFVGQKKANGLKRLLTSIHIVSQKQVVCFWRETSILKKSEEIVVLAVNVSTNLDWSFEFKKNRLIDENISGLNAETSDLLLCELNLLSWTTSKL